MSAGRELVRRLRYFGHSVECPICEHHFGRFADVPQFGPVRCPGCGSLPRQRFLWLYLSRGELLRDGAAVLHVAPEPGLSERIATADGVDYTSADIRAGAADVKADLTALPFEDRRFDLLLCSHVLEHVADDRAAMREMRRVLKPGGTAVVQTPVNYAQARTFEDASVQDPAERERLFSQADHVRVYGPDLRLRLQEAGFLVAIADAGNEPEESVTRYGLLPRWRVLRNDLYRCDVAGTT